MHQQELLDQYLKRLAELAQATMKERNLPPLEALKEALHFIEGEMKGY